MLKREQFQALSRGLGNAAPAMLVLVVLTLLTPCGHGLGQAADPANRPTVATQERLQGTWEGKQDSGEKISIKISGYSLRYEGQATNDWYEVTFAVPEKTDPPELRATITASPQTNHVGAVVRAIFKIEDGNLTLVGIQDRDKEPPKAFGNDQAQRDTLDGGFTLAGSLPGSTGAKAFEDNSVFRYELRKVQPQEKKTAAAAAK
jgi:hypothetical protein